MATRGTLRAWKSIGVVVLAASLLAGVGRGTARAEDPPSRMSDEELFRASIAAIDALDSSAVIGAHGAELTMKFKDVLDKIVRCIFPNLDLGPLEIEAGHHADAVDLFGRTVAMMVDLPARLTAESSALTEDLVRAKALYQAILKTDKKTIAEARRALEAAERKLVKTTEHNTKEIGKIDEQIAEVHADIARKVAKAAMQGKTAKTEQLQAKLLFLVMEKVRLVTRIAEALKEVADATAALAVAEAALVTAKQELDYLEAKKVAVDNTLLNIKKAQNAVITQTAIVRELESLLGRMRAALADPQRCR